MLQKLKQKQSSALFTWLWVILALIFFILAIWKTFSFLSVHSPSNLLQSILQSTSPTIGQRFCPAVAVAAKNPKTGECKTFATPCDIPKGWMATTSCQVTSPTAH